MTNLSFLILYQVWWLDSGGSDFPRRYSPVGRDLFSLYNGKTHINRLKDLLSIK